MTTCRRPSCEIGVVDRCDRSLRTRVQAEAQGGCCARVQVLAAVASTGPFCEGRALCRAIFAPGQPSSFCHTFVGWPFAFCLCAVSSASLFIRGLYCIEQSGMMPSSCRIAGQYKNCKPEICFMAVAELVYSCTFARLARSCPLDLPTGPPVRPAWFTAVPLHAWHALARWTCRPVRLCVPLGRRSEWARISH